ncbi:hypothetical protein [Pontimicrobium aquaticum]|uniref:Uncharacterized protein n=1 Tax=Pontimicrobium aquaticum TaxID=2565367 RepID=A0A4V5LQL7_9FLAO|nr:hypothetical protein [Pontimicrobium aquaticum]TJY35889.1 hypothetical protein E5167_08455 [Pontimicrobium aquaticum]
MNDLEIVFFHELGHYIAHELNYELYGIGKVESIDFIEYQLPNGLQYQGKTIPLVSDGDNRDKELTNLPEKIAELVYGCYFQTLYTKLPFKSCFDFHNDQSKGYIDAKCLVGALMQFRINRERIILYPYLNEEYFDELTKRESEFNSVFRINYEDCINKTDSGYVADLHKLYELTTDFRKLHKPTFQKFVERIKEIINWEKIKDS